MGPRGHGIIDGTGGVQLTQPSTDKCTHVPASHDKTLCKPQPGTRLLGASWKLPFGAITG